MSWQIVQLLHAGFELGLKLNHKYSTPPSIVLCEVSNEQKLLEIQEIINQQDIYCESFYEPYKDTGITAFVTIPVTESQRHIFKKYQLWKNPHANTQHAIKDSINAT